MTVLIRMSFGAFPLTLALSIVRALDGLVFQGLVHIGLVCLFAQRRQIRVCRGSLGHGKAHGAEHGVFFGFFQLALFFGELVGGGAPVGVGVTFGVPVEVFALLPAAHG